jgi:ABC-type lipoprotein release transport system permease subunit
VVHAGTVPWAFRQPIVVRSTLRRWRGTLGMVGAVGLALGLVLTMLAMIEGSTWLYVGDYQTSGADLYVLQRGGTLVPLLPGEGLGSLGEARHRLSQARAAPGVRAAVGVVAWPLRRTPDAPVRRQPVERVMAVGVDGDPRGIPDALDLRAGRWLAADEEIVLGPKLARDKGLAVGDALTLEGRRVRVVGIGKLRGASMAGDGAAFLDRRVLQQLGAVGDRLDFIVVDADDPAATAAVLASQMTSVDVWDRARIVGALDQLLSRSMTIWNLVAGLALFVAGVFVSSMLLRSVAERRSELATLRAIGVPARTIAALVVGEAALVVLLATVAGFAVSRVLGLWLDRTLAESLNMDSIYRVTPAMVLRMSAIALVVGGLAALLPTRRALAVEPADVLRQS